MENKTDVIKLYLKEVFSETRIRKDLLEYSSNFFVKSEAGGYLVNVANFDNSKIETIEIKPIEDAVTIIEYKLVFEFDIDEMYSIKIAIGKYTDNPDNQSLFLVDKCLASLKYNGDFSLYDIEFVIDCINVRKC